MALAGFLNGRWSTILLLQQAFRGGQEILHVTI
jgi:hypothetical protein